LSSSIYVNKEKDEHVIVLEDGGHRLRVKRDGFAWSLKIDHAQGPTTRETAWATVTKADGLRSSKNAKQIRESYSLIFGAKNSDKKIDETIDILQTQSYYWPIIDNEDTPQTTTPTDKALESLSIYSFKTPEDIENLYIFRDGEYVQGEPFVKGVVETLFGNKTNTGLCGEIVNHLKRRSYVARLEFNRFDGEIPVLNGLLNLSTGTQRDFTPDKIFTFKIQAKYNPTKKSERWLKFLEEVLPVEEDRLALQEYAGYCLYPKFPFHKMAFLVGSGRNGKGVFVRTIQSILGVENVANIRLDQLNGGNRFAATNLYGKLMNISSEPSTRWPLQTELLKQLTGEDWLDGEVKGKQNPVRFQPFAKHFVLANKLPKVNDTSVGWWERVLIVIWEQTFTEENGKQVVSLENNWLTEDDDRSGILNWLIEGWKRLNANGRFTQSKTMREAMIQFKRASDPIAAFLAEECEHGPDYYMLRDAFYDAYKDYAKSLNATPEGVKVFWERMRSVPGIDITHKKRVEGKAQRVVFGVKTRGEPDADTLDDFNRSESEALEASEAPVVTPVSTESVLIKKREIEDKEEGVEIHASNASSASPQQNKCEVCGSDGNFRFSEKWLCRMHLDEAAKATKKVIPEVTHWVINEVNPVSLMGAREALLGRVELRGDGLELEAALEFLGKLGLNVSLGTKVVSSMMRDGVIFSPRSGWYKAT
jgi:P4 family phage/plasmid primase-like protien